MSRIHEALKKAGEQRAASQGGSIGPTPIAEMVNEPAATAVAPAVEHTPSTVSAIPPFSSPFTFDTLLARCAQARWSPDSKTMLFFNSEDEQGYGMEEFRTLRSRLYQMREKQSLKKVLVTSSLPKEGKSFVAANLAQVMVRQQGRRALLIDGDLRGPACIKCWEQLPVPASLSICWVRWMSLEPFSAAPWTIFSSFLPGAPFRVRRNWSPMAG